MGGNGHSDSFPHFYLRLHKEAPVRFKWLRNLWYWWNLKPVIGENHRQAKKDLASKLNLDEKYVDVIVFS